jgi:hypothetical protein
MCTDFIKDLGVSWEDDIKVDLKKFGFKDVDWIHLAQGGDQWPALANIVMNLQVA